MTLSLKFSGLQTRVLFLCLAIVPFLKFGRKVTSDWLLQLCTGNTILEVTTNSQS